MILLWMVKQKSEKNSRIECVCLQSSWSGQNHNNCAGFSRIIRLHAEPYLLGGEIRHLTMLWRLSL